MQYKKYNIKGNEIYLIKTNKYKTITIDTLLINEYDKSEITKYKFLSNYMSRCTKKYSDELKMRKKFLELYDLDIGIFNFYLNYHIQTFRVTFLNDIYTEKGLNKESIKFYYDFIYKPNIIDGKLDDDNYILTKRTLQSFYKRQQENYNFKAERNSFYNISEDIPLKNNISDNLKDLNKINKKNIVDLYNKLINESSCKVFVIGNFNESEILNLLNDNLKKCKNPKEYTFKKYELTKTDKSNEIIDNDKNNQSIIIMLFKILNLTEKERFYVLPIFNAILGGSNSKLFNNVRENNSLAYYIYSTIYVYQSILKIEAGISKDNYKKVKEISLKQINEILKGNVTQKELNNAKQGIIVDLLSNDDSQIRLLNNIIDQIIFYTKPTKETIEEIKKVTVSDLKKLAKKINLDVSYLLKGEK